MKKLISIITALALLLSGLGAVAAETEVTLTPLSFDETGVIPWSSFLLSGYSGEDPVVTVNGAITTTAEKNADGSFTITADEPLEYNKLYSFKLAGDKPRSWVFQTARRFALVGSLPGANAYRVPINSGIEFTFTHSDLDMASIEQSFTIKPRVDGRWEQHKETAVFVPTVPLEYGEEYTVTLAGTAGQLGGANLGADHSFTFNTEEEPVTDIAQNQYFWVYSYNRYCEIPASVAPILDFYSYTSRGYAGEHILRAEVFTLDEDASVSWLIGDITTKALTENLSEPIMSFDYDMSEDDYGDIELTLPGPLPNGFYLVKVSSESDYAQTVVQSTDMAAYIVADAKRQYGLWLNNYVSGDALSGVSLSLNGAEAAAVTDDDGLALLPMGEKNEYIKAVAPDGETAYYPVRNYSLGKNKYHVLLETERPLYQPDDTVYLWGAVKPYPGIEAPSELTVELRRGSYSSNPLLTQKVTAEDGVFTAEVKLPDLKAGSYYLYLKNGDARLGSAYISVQEYVKPDYKLTITADKKAIFLGESINYTAKASFFDGTALPELELSRYSSNTYGFGFFDGSGITDKNGEMSFTVTPEALPRVGQGNRSINMTVRATLPETGEISDSTYATILLNDISLRLSSEFENGVSTITVHSDALTTDKVNSGEGYDYIKGPDAGRQMTGSLVFTRYMNEQTGTGYNYITKRSYPIYRYYTVQEPVSEFTLVTDSEGNAAYSFTPTETEGGYYSVKISCIDGMNREYTASGSVRTSERYWSWYSNYSYPKLVSDKDSYDLGDSAELCVVEAGETVEGRFLYIRDHNGITDMQVGGGVYNTVFDSAPKIFIQCIEFEPGSGYTEVSYNTLSYDTENSRINIEAQFDKEKYAPGESCEVSVKTTDKKGNPVSANISMGVVDEALFALRDQSVDMLREFFTGFSRCVTSVYESHFYASYLKEPGESGSASYWGSGGGAGSAAPKSPSGALRYDFRDTAAFISAKTDENGEAVLTFDLPHNTTTWRATFLAVNDTGAGDAQLPIIVTMPAFLSWNINETYLVGDIPDIGVALYGSDLRGDETVTFITDDGVTVSTVQGRPFERVNLPLSSMDAAGERTITVSAEIDGHTVDTVQETVTVIDTYNRTLQETIHGSPFESIPSDGTGNVRITFTDKNRASLLSGIYRMRRWAGDRIDQVVSNYRATELLNTYYGAELVLPEIDWGSYQSSNGGIRLLSYGSSDPELTSRLTPYIKDRVDKDLLISYLRSHETEPGALYALAVLREPVLDKLTAVAEAENISPVELLYTVLAFCELGDMDTAQQVYARVEPLYEDFGDMRRILTGEDNDDILEATSLAAMAAMYLGRSDAESLYRYSVTNCTSDILINLEIMAYIDAAIKTLPEETGSVTYELYGQSYTKEFRGRESYSLEVPAARLSEFRVVSASDSVMMVSAAERKIDIEQLENPHVSIERSYFKNGTSEPTATFDESDIVMVQIIINYSEQALEGGYVINDYLPSGLELIKGDSRYRSSYFCSGSGQRVRLSSYFYDDKADRNNTKTLTYYARVVSPGEFTADNATVQSVRSPEILAASGRARVTVSSRE